jgi:hypothetical protein
MATTYLIILLFFAILISYILGRRVGFKEGFIHGVCYGPLELRKQALEKGYCPICGYGRESLEYDAEPTCECEHTAEDC